MHTTSIRLISYITAFCLLICPAQAILKIDITQGNIDPLPIAIAEMAGNSTAEEKMGQDVVDIIEQDLESSGLFKSINHKAFLQDIKGSDTLPIFSHWRKINASGLIMSDINSSSFGKVSANFRLWDVFAEQQIAGKSYTTEQKNWRRIGHLIADEVYKRLTGEEGYFDSRIAYIAESGSLLKRTKRLAVMDQDGYNHRYMTDGKNLVLTPRFSPEGREIIYLSYVSGMPRVYIRDIYSGKEKIVGNFPGMSFAPRYAPDGDSVVMSVSLEGNSEIYLLDLKTNTKKRLTHNPAIDTSPSYSPDGQKIVFNSDRGGTQQLYVMNKDGSQVERISFSGKGRYGAPVWSPRNDYIAFTKMQNGKFYIGVVHADGSGERLLTESYLDEGPAWSPNGRIIMFARQTSLRGKRQLYSIDLTGYNERKISTPGEASDPAWSSLH